jgi:CCR4-NOT transcription complex subunit 3
VNQFVTPPYYPQEASGLFDDPAIYRKVELDVLFFIFFYQQGTYQQ